VHRGVNYRNLQGCEWVVIFFFPGTVFIMIGVIANTHVHMQGSGLLTGTVHKKMSADVCISSFHSNFFNAWLKFVNQTGLTKKL
jgi:Na+/H+ antiporter NhaD/arsenite permease-like protein